MKKKGQAALEFLMTYGWAILAAVIVIGVLYFLIGNPSNLAGDKFLMAAPFTAGEHALSVANGIQLEVINGAGKSIDLDNDATAGIDSITIAGCTGNPTATGIADINAWAAGETATFTWTAANCGVANGDRLNGNIEISYTAGSSTLVQIGSGSISGTVRA